MSNMQQNPDGTWSEAKPMAMPSYTNRMTQGAPACPWCGERNDMSAYRLPKGPFLWECDECQEEFVITYMDGTYATEAHIP